MTLWLFHLHVQQTSGVQRLHRATACPSSLSRALPSAASSRDSKSPSTTGALLLADCSHCPDLHCILSAALRLQCGCTRDQQREQALAEKRNPQPPRVVSLLPLSQVCYFAVCALPTACIAILSTSCSLFGSTEQHLQCRPLVLTSKAWVLNSPTAHFRVMTTGCSIACIFQLLCLLSGCGRAKAMGSAHLSWDIGYLQSCQCRAGHGC